MELMEAIFTRRSIRSYSGKKIDDPMVEKIIHAAMYAPSAVDKQPWHFIVFDDTGTYEAIMKFHRSASMLAEAQKCILICYDENLQHDEGYGIIDCSAATQNLLLAAHGLGLGACWIGIQPRRERVSAFQGLFHLPRTIVPFALISLGYPAEIKATPDRIRPERIHIDKW